MQKIKNAKPSSDSVKKIIIVILITLILLSGLIYENKAYFLDKEPQIYIQVGKAVIRPYRIGDVYHIFLPSFEKTSGAKLTDYSEPVLWSSESQPETEILTGESQSEAAEWNKVNKGKSISDLPVNRTLLCRRSGSDETYQLCIWKSENLPTVFINTSSGNLDNLQADKEHEETGDILLYDVDGKVLVSTALEKIKGRGNASFGYDKKSWNIELEKASDLFNMGKDTRYVLVANALDPTLIRNDLMRRLEQKMEIPYVKIGQFTDVYINGEYQGNYYLCAPVTAGKNRIAIKDPEELSEDYRDDIPYETMQKYEDEKVKACCFPELDQMSTLDITGGYLMERDFMDRFMFEYDDISSSFITNNEECFIMKEPKYCSVRQIQYISSFMDEVECSIMSPDGINHETGKSYTEYIDLDSFTKRYLAEEISKNYDGGVSSTYFYKDSDTISNKLFFAPGWDYDMSLGNYVEWMTDISEDPEGLTYLDTSVNSSPWYRELYEKNEFYDTLVKNYKEYALPFLENEMPLLIDHYEQTMDASYRMNHLRWDDDLQAHAYYTDLEDAFDVLRDFIKKRTLFLNKEWLGADGLQS